jgi:AraC family transcriptional regulator
MATEITFGRTLAKLALPSVTITETWHPPGLRLDRHAHPNPNINFVLAGQFLESIEGKAFSCSAGSVLIKPQGAIHSNDYCGGSRSLIIEFSSAEIYEGRTWCNLATDPLLCNEVDLAPLGWQLYRELRTDDGSRQIGMEALIIALLDTLADTKRRLESASSAPYWLKHLRELLDDSPLTVSIDDLVREAAVHPGYMMRAFRRFTGCSIGEYLRRRRIRQAQDLLAGSNLTITTVAADCGFYDHSHFIRIFKRLTGFTPSRYRELSRNPLR